MHYLFFLLVLITLTSFTTPKYQKYAYKLMNSYSKQITKEANIEIIGTGGSMRKDVEKVTLHFVSHQKMDLESARKLYVKIVEGFLNKINTNEQIQPYLHNRPFTISNLDIKISFWDNKSKHFDEKSVAFVYFAKNKIYYSYFFENTDSLEDLHGETYEEALKAIYGNEYVPQTMSSTSSEKSKSVAVIFVGE